MATMAINTASAANMPPAMFHKTLPFAQLKNDALARFEAIAPEVSRSRGETLFVEGETPRYVLLDLLWTGQALRKFPRRTDCHSARCRAR